MKSLRGSLLAATPDLLDPNFAGTVLLLLEHNDAGAVGVVLNRPTEATVSDVAEQVLDEPFAWEKPIGLGGPVTGPLMALHTEKALADQEVFPGLYSTAEAKRIEALLRARTEPSVLLANYAGWGGGQLERELAEGSWLVLPATVDVVLSGDPDNLWDLAISSFRTGSHPPWPRRSG